MPSCLRALHSFEVFAIDAAFANIHLVNCPHGPIQVTRDDIGSEPIITIIRKPDRFVEFGRCRDDVNGLEFLSPYNVDFPFAMG